MNVKRYTARTAREALQQVKQALGDDAVVLSTKPCPEGVEVLAMAPESMRQIERMSSTAAPAAPAAPSSASAPARSAAAARPATAARASVNVAPPADTPPEQDAQALSMSTLSFQDYVRTRMLKRRQAAIRAEAGDSRLHEPAEPRFDDLPAPGWSAEPAPADRHAAPAPSPTAAARALPPERDRASDAQRQLELAERLALREVLENGAAQRAALADDDRAPLGVAPPVLREEFNAAGLRAMPRTPIGLSDARTTAPAPEALGVSRRDHEDMLRELRSMKGLIEDRFGALAFMDKLQKSPKQALLTQRLLDCGFSPALIRKLSEGLSPAVADEMAWAAGVLERNLSCAENEPALEEQGGVLALVGPTGVGKTTSTAKLAAAFATRHGASQLGLITLDAYRVGAHEQLRAYGRILGVSVHTAHDRASLDDLLDLLSAKRMVLIDTAGMAQRDSRTAELLDMLGHPSIRKLLVINAAAQGETTEDVMNAYRAGQACGVVLSKVDEAVKLGPALDVLIRNRVKVMAVANGQRVPEDWHRLSAQALVQRALKTQPGGAYRHDNHDVNLVFTAPSTASLPAGYATGRSPAEPRSIAARQADTLRE